jgi:hypothetical protein
VYNIFYTLVYNIIYTIYKNSLFQSVCQTQRQAPEFKYFALQSVCLTQPTLGAQRRNLYRKTTKFKDAGAEHRNMHNHTIKAFFFCMRNKLENIFRK